MAERTFKEYNQVQARAYATGRGGYDEKLYDLILEYHNRTGGKLERVVDLGCGPGNVTRPLARHFKHALGLDESPGMLEEARRQLREGESLPFPSTGRSGATATQNIDFVLGKAEEIGTERVPGTGPGEVDLISAATAAHWFDMPKFWLAASRALRPGGTVAIWAAPRLLCHPSTPYSSQVQQLFDRFEYEDVKDFELTGNRICGDHYDKLILPWSLPGGAPAVPGFSADHFERHVIDREGVQSPEEHYFLGEVTVPLSRLEKGIETGSKVTRWREAHPDLAHTENDIVARTSRELKEALHGGDEITLGRSCVILLFKRI